MTFQSVRDSIIYVDFPGFISHFAITGDNLRPDLRLVLLNKCLYILKLKWDLNQTVRNHIFVNEEQLLHIEQILR